MTDYPSAQEWFALGKPVPYDRRTKRILQSTRGPGSPDVATSKQRQQATTPNTPETHHVPPSIPLHGAPDLRPILQGPVWPSSTTLVSKIRVGPIDAPTLLPPFA